MEAEGAEDRGCCRFTLPMWTRSEVRVDSKKVMSINWRFERPLAARKACGGPGNAFIPHPPRWPRARTKFARRHGANSAEVAHTQTR